MYSAHGVASAYMKRNSSTLQTCGSFKSMLSRRKDDTAPAFLNLRTPRPPKTETFSPLCSIAPPSTPPSSQLPIVSLSLNCSSPSSHPLVSLDPIHHLPSLHPLVSFSLPPLSSHSLVTPSLPSPLPSPSRFSHPSLFPVPRLSPCLTLSILSPLSSLSPTPPPFSLAPLPPYILPLPLPCPSSPCTTPPSSPHLASLSPLSTGSLLSPCMFSIHTFSPPASSTLSVLYTLIARSSASTLSLVSPPSTPDQALSTIPILEPPLPPD